MRRAAPIVLACLLGGLALLAVLLRLRYASGPAEWRWQYRPFGLGSGWLAALAAVAALTLFVKRRSPLSGAATATAVAALALALTGAVVAAQPGGFTRVVESTVSRHAFGFVFDAGVAPPTGELLADFPAASAGLFLHSRTHPPGPLLLVRGLDALARPLEERLPGPPRGVLETAAEAFRREMHRAGDRRQPVPRRPPCPLAVVALAVLLPALSAFAAVPLYALVRDLGGSPRAAGLAAVLWAVVPARTLFTPSLDQALPALLLAAVWLAGRRSLIGPALAGLLLAAACLLSYGCLALAPAVAVAAVAVGNNGPEAGGGNRWLRGRGTALAALVGGFLLPWLGLAIFTGYDPWTAFRTALLEHRRMAVEVRSYALWLLFDPYDFALLAGPAVTLLALRGLSKGSPRPLWRVLATSALALSVVWLAGSVRGEVGRVWLPWMPFLAAAAALAIDRIEEPVASWGGAAVVATQAAGLLGLAASLVFVR